LLDHALNKSCAAHDSRKQLELRVLNPSGEMRELFSR
jgi:hypothetical protein